MERAFPRNISTSAHDWGQVLMFEGKSRSHFGSFTTRLRVESRLGSFGNQGNGRYREELRQGLAAIGRYLTAYQLPQARALLRLDGQYGMGPCSLIWPGSPMFPEAERTPFLRRLFV
jgi:hypothetical protein